MNIPIPANQAPRQALLAIARNRDRYFSDIILDRTESYAYEDCTQLLGVTPQRIQGASFGSMPYKLSVKLSGSQLSFDCSCPYDGNCKHLAAFLQLLDENWAEELQPFGKLESLSHFSDYLTKRSKKELIVLVERFAPDSFREEIALRYLPKDQRAEKLIRLRKQLDHFLAREHYDPDTFEQELQPFLNKLKGHYESTSKEAQEIIMQVISSIKQMQEEGYLYDDYQDAIYEGDQVVFAAVELLLNLSGSDQSAYFSVFKKALDNEYYDTFPSLILCLINSAKSREYQLSSLEPLFSTPDFLDNTQPHEQRAILDYLALHASTDELHNLQLKISTTYPEVLYDTARQLADQEKGQQAITLLDEMMEKPKDDDFLTVKLFELRIELAQQLQNKKAVKRWCKRYLKAIPNAHPLRIVCAAAPKEKEKWITLLTKMNPLQVANFHLDNQEPEAVLPLLDAYPEEFDDTFFKTRFFENYPGQFPDRASELAYRLLDQYLPTTGSFAYKQVIKALELLRDNADPEYVLITTQEIKTNYRRRSKLMGMMLKAGF